jgi:large subunit ribosomal protein L10
MVSSSTPVKRERSLKLVTRQQKEDVIERIKKESEGATIAFTADFSAMDVKEITELRRSVKSAKCMVVKNTLAERALNGSEFSEVAAFLQGPTLLVFGKDEASKSIKDFIDFSSKVKPKLALKGGVIAGDAKALSGSDLQAIGNLPPKEVLFAQIAGSLTATPTQLVQTINQIIGGIGQLAVKVAEKNAK